MRRRPVRAKPGTYDSEAAVSLLLRPSGDGLKFLAIKRAESEGDPWSGHMALPGGRRDAEDEDLWVTAVRETWEETGLIVCEPTLEDVVYCGVHDGYYCVTFHTYIEGESCTPVSSTEGEAAWVWPEDLLQLTCTYRDYNKVVLGMDDDD